MNPLCSTCRQLDLANRDNRKPQTYQLGVWEDVIARSSRCHFCALLIRISGDVAPNHAAWVMWQEAGGFQTGNPAKCIAYVDGETTSSPNGMARRVKSLVDISMVKRWIELCEVTHGGTCQPKPGPLLTPDNPAGLTTFRLLDVVDQCIVDAEPEMRYVALSYVWGPNFKPNIFLSTDNYQELYKPGALRRNWDKLPLTIRDATEFVRRIGERYLWNDSLCLVQNDPKDVLQGVSRMDMVYQCAFLTLVVANGTDANAGLARLNNASTWGQQEPVEVLPGLHMTTTSSAHEDLTWTSYHERGWTMQELALSYRALIFTEQIVYFCCRANAWSEDTIFDRFPKAVNSVQRQIGFLEDYLWYPHDVYHNMVSTFSQRKLSKQEDTINAFTGILRQLAIQAKSGVLHGLMTDSFDIGLAFRSSGQCARRQGFASWSWAGWTGEKHTDANIFVNGGTFIGWLHNMTYIDWYVRTPQAPQLTGIWKLPIESGHNPRLRKVYMGLVLQSPFATSSAQNNNAVSADRSPTYYMPHANPELANLQRLPSESDKTRQINIFGELRKRNYPLLHFFAHVVYAPRLLPVSLASVSLERIYQVFGSDSTVCGTISVDDPKLLDSVQGPFEFIILSRVNLYGQFFPRMTIPTKKEMHCAMLIAWTGKNGIVAERRGIGFLYFDAIQAALGTKHWKEIILG